MKEAAVTVSTAVELNVTVVTNAVNVVAAVATAV